MNVTLLLKMLLIKNFNIFVPQRQYLYNCQVFLDLSISKVDNKETEPNFEK